MKLTVHKSNKLEDGKHEGVIRTLEYRDVTWKGETLEYLDLGIETDDGVKVTVGFNSYVSPDSMLGKLLTLFGADLECSEIDPETLLKNTACTFLTVTNDKGYTEVVKKSVKPK